MLSWIKKTGVTTEPTRRAFRPAADRLESREVLSTISTSFARSSLTLPRPLANANFHVFTAGMESPSLYAPRNSFPTGLVNRVVPTLASTASRFSSATSQANRSLVTTLSATRLLTTAPITSQTSPRLGGFQSNVNPALFSAGGRLGTLASSLTSSSNSILNNVGKSGLVSNYTLNGFSNNATPNSLSFINSLVSNIGLNRLSTNSASTGLAFTNGLGFSTPSIGSNSASTGLAFTNGLGFSTPSIGSNSAQNGLAFNSGLGSTNVYTNPFLGGTNSFAGSTFSTNGGMGFSSNSPMYL